MSSFFSIPGQKKRKRPAAAEPPKKRIAASKPAASSKRTPSKSAAIGPTKRRAERDDDPDDDDNDDDDEISSSDSDESINKASAPDSAEEDSGSEIHGETAAERRLRLAERYLENVKQQVDAYGFDAEEIDRDLIAERLLEDVAEEKGKVYRNIASELVIEDATHTFFKRNTHTFTSVAASSPYVYTTTKDMFLHKWRIQDLPRDQFPQTTRKKPKKPPAPPRRQPELEQWLKGDARKAADNNYKRHVDQILCVAASPDGKYVATGGADKRLIVYDAETLRPLRVFTQHRDAVMGLAFRRGTNQLYSCSRDRTVKVWSLDELAYVETLFGHQDQVVDVDALAQERCVSVGARDRTARLWKVAEETQLVFRGGGGGDKKAASSRPGIDPKALAHEGSVDRVAMIDDDLFVTGSDNGSLALWSLQKKKPVHVYPLAHGADPPPAPLDASAEEHPDQKLEVGAPPKPRWITALETIPYSDVVLSGSWDGFVRVWRLSADKKKIEPVGVLGGREPGTGLGLAELANGKTNGATTGGESRERDLPWEIKGVVNDLTVFERGERGVDGLCVVAAVGKEHRLGRWARHSGARNGGVVFEVPRVQRPAGGGAVNGVHDMNGAEME